MQGIATLPVFALLVSVLISACGKSRKAPQLSDYISEKKVSSSDNEILDNEPISSDASGRKPVESSDAILVDETKPIAIPVQIMADKAQATSLSLSYCASPWCYYKANGLDGVVIHEGSVVTLDNQIVKFNSLNFSIFRNFPTDRIEQNKTYGLFVSAKMKSMQSCARIYYDIQFYSTASDGTVSRTRYQRSDATIQESGEIPLNIKGIDFASIDTNAYIVISLNFNTCAEGLSEFESLKTEIHLR